MKIVFVRSMLTLSLPFILAWAFASTFCREIASAFKYAWLEILIECETFRRLWREIPERLNA